MIAGGCRCGACRYELALDALPPVYCCHCTDCQCWSGSAFSEQAVIPAGAVTTTGPVIEFTLSTPSGAQTHQRACGICHTRLWNINSARPAVATVRAGTLDDNRTLTPRAHIWVRSKQSWVVLPEGVPQWPEMAPLAEFMAALAG